MCFSLEADLAVGLSLLPVGVLSLREVRRPREVPFASLPLLFSAHQLIEGLVWAGMDGRVSPGVQQAATLAYLVIALPVLPLLVPLAVLLLEPQGSRRRLSGFVVLGAVVATYFTLVLVTSPASVTAHPFALAYDTGVTNGWLWTALYVVAVIGAPLRSSYQSVVVFGFVNLLGLTLVALVYAEGFISLWCVQAAMASLLVLVHMVRRRRLADADRLEGRLAYEPVEAPSGTARTSE
jgi:hypothetical protein